MARYTGPIFKKARRYKFSILENGKEFSKGKRRQYAPGQHGKNQERKKLSDFGLHLYEKQKLKNLYWTNERQFSATFDKASKMKGETGINFMVLLESRLDNIVYRLGFAQTRRQARQIVSHNHIIVDGKKANIPSMIIKIGQKISVKEKAKKLDIIKMAIEAKPSAVWLSRDDTKFEGTYDRFPERNEIHKDIKIGLIVEHYSK